MKRVNLSPDEVALVEAFRTEKNIYNTAIADVVAAILQSNGGPCVDNAPLTKDIISVILKLRK